MVEAARVTAATTSAPWHSLSPRRVATLVEADLALGLSEGEAALRLRRSGPNALPEQRSTPIAYLFLRQYRSPLVYLLIGAAALAFGLGQRTDAWVILTIVTANALLGALQEGRAERSMAALRRLTASHARVLRGGRERVVEARELVTGDVILLAAGDAVSADARLVEAASLDVVAAALTGESLPVRKTDASEASETLLADRGSMIYAATHVAAGRGRAVVVATGSSTEVGKIAALTATAVEPQTPLGRRIAELGRIVTYAGLSLSAAAVVIGLARGLPMGSILMVAVSQLVAMVPEGLPVAVTVALALGARRIAKRGALVRRIAAVETLGSTTVICSDKTGTLTSNEMCVTDVRLASGRELAVTGTGYAPDGEVHEANGSSAAGDRDLVDLAEAVVLCNDSRLAPPISGESRWRAIGDPTEAALLSFAKKAGADADAVRARAPRTEEVPFEAETKMMATRHDGAAGAFVVLKGAPERVLERCSFRQMNGERRPLDDASKAELEAAWEEMAERALRVLAVATAPDPGKSDDGIDVRDATLLGLVGQIDPAREGVREAIDRCRAAGIRVMMITGDHEATARAVAKTLGIPSDEDEVLGGAEIDGLGDVELTAALERVSVFARVHPAQKLRIVKALQARGEVVAMTGDGVNDAPALASADVGIAMGRVGTEVAKMASKVILTDDDFTTIVRAVEEGRTIHVNLKKLILYLVSTAVAGVVILLTALTLGWPVPLAAVHILWINLVTDGAVALPLSTGGVDGDVMRRPPVPTREPLVTRPLLRRMAFMVPSMVLSTLGWFGWRLHAGVPAAQASVEAFTVLASAQWFNALSCRSATESALVGLRFGRDRWLLLGVGAGILLQAGALYTSIGNRMLHTVPLPPSVLGLVLVAGSLVLWVEEIRKLVTRLVEPVGRRALVSST
ncbi:MAG: HAD-IC family P-type ATPase [Deltaproteobacteria bacterium]|nr:HAD-IC family P-type ATPase [Deltaproteobacteria bacterium]